MNTNFRDVTCFSRLSDAVNEKLIALAKAGKVTLLPHMGSATHEGRADMGEKVIINIRTFADGHRPPAGRCRACSEGRADIRAPCAFRMPARPCRRHLIPATGRKEGRSRDFARPCPEKSFDSSCLQNKPQHVAGKITGRITGP
jgi:hypothetical protein